MNSLLQLTRFFEAIKKSNPSAPTGSLLDTGHPPTELPIQKSGTDRSIPVLVQKYGEFTIPLIGHYDFSLLAWVVYVSGTANILHSIDRWFDLPVVALSKNFANDVADHYGWHTEVCEQCKGRREVVVPIPDRIDFKLFSSPESIPENRPIRTTTIPCWACNWTGMVYVEGRAFLP